MQDDALLRPDTGPSVPDRVEAKMERRALLVSLAKFQIPSVRHSVGQLVVTGAAYVGLIALMYYATLHHAAWLAFLLTIPAAGFVVRLFIIQHDCGHSAYFRSSAYRRSARLCAGQAFQDRAGRHRTLRR